MTAKCALASPPTLSLYDPSRSTSLWTDASRLHGHRTSPYHYPQSNTQQRAEATVKSMEKLFGRCWDSAGARLNKGQWMKGILQYRNTPTPAQLLFGQPVHDMVPLHHCAFKPEYQKAADTSDTLPADAEAVARYNSSAHPLSSLQIGTPVVVQNDRTKLWDRSSVVVDVSLHRKYFIRLPSDRILTRNRSFLCRRYSSILPPSDAPTPPPTDQKPPFSANPVPASVPLASAHSFISSS